MIGLKHYKANRRSPQWLANAPETYNAQTYKLKTSDFATAYTFYSGLPSGYPLVFEGEGADKVVKPAPAGGKIDAFLLFDFDFTPGEYAVAVVLDGQIDKNYLPKIDGTTEVTKPADTGHFIWI